MTTRKISENLSVKKKEVHRNIDALIQDIYKTLDKNSPNSFIDDQFLAIEHMRDMLFDIEVEEHKIVAEIIKENPHTWHKDKSFVKDVSRYIFEEKTREDYKTSSHLCYVTSAVEQ